VKNQTDITLVLDRTGSMSSIKEATIVGFNTFLKDQKEAPGEAVFTLVQFDSEDPYEVLQNGVPINDARELTDETFVPRASTPLRDAIGRTIEGVGARLIALQEDQRPDKIVIVIQTDGLENASKEFSAERVRQMIEHQKTVYGWQFVFLGANQDAVLVAGKMGIDVTAAITFAASDAGTSASAKCMSRGVKEFRSKGKWGGFSDEDRLKSMSK